MKKIYKLTLETIQTVAELPRGAEPLYVGLQGEKIQLWFLFQVDIEGSEVRTFQIFGTGHDIPLHARYIGTVQPPNGLVWHIFDTSPRKYP